MIETTDPDRINEIIQEKEVVIIDFTAEWCGPCKILKNELDKVEKKHDNLEIIRVDVDKVNKKKRTFVKAFPLYKNVIKIGAIPVTMYFKGGKLFGKIMMESLEKEGIQGVVIGLIDERTIEKVLEQLNG